MNIHNLGTGKYADFTSRLGNAYQQIAGGNEYRKNTRDLRVIQWAVVTVSAIATGFTNGYAHRDRIGEEASFCLALLIVAFVERFYFVLRHSSGRGKLSADHRADRMQRAGKCYTGGEKPVAP